MCLHDARRRAGQWTLATLRKRLGEDWLARTAERSDGSFPLGLDLLGSHTLAVVKRWSGPSTWTSTPAADLPRAHDHRDARIAQRLADQGRMRRPISSTLETDYIRSIVRSKESTRRTPVDSALATR